MELTEKLAKETEAHKQAVDLQNSAQELLENGHKQVEELEKRLKQAQEDQRRLEEDHDIFEKITAEQTKSHNEKMRSLHDKEMEELQDKLNTLNEEFSELKKKYDLETSEIEQLKSALNNTNTLSTTLHHELEQANEYNSELSIINDCTYLINVRHSA